jgi:putative sterol carrier protein
MNSLKIEGKKYNINVNAIAPVAASRLTEGVIPPDMFKKMKPEFIAPLVLYLTSEECAETGGIFNAGMGYYNKASIVTGNSVKLGDDKNPVSPEMIKDNLDSINSITESSEYFDLNTAVMDFMTVKEPKPDIKPDEKPDEKSDNKETAEKKGGKAVGVGQIFENMGKNFNKDAASGVNVVFQFNISGDAGGDWFAEIKDKTCNIASGKHDKPACTLKIKSDNFIDMMTGKLPAMQAFTTGKLKIEGDIMKSQLIEKLFKLN